MAADREEIRPFSLRRLRQLARTFDEDQHVLPLGRTAFYDGIASGKSLSVHFGQAFSCRLRRSSGSSVSSQDPASEHQWHPYAHASSSSGLFAQCGQLEDQNHERKV